MLRHMVRQCVQMRHVQIKMDLSRQLAQIAQLETQLESLLTEQQPNEDLAKSIGRLSEEKQKLHYQIDILKRAIQRFRKIKLK